MKSYPWLKAEDVTKMIEDDRLSSISGLSTSTDLESTDLESCKSDSTCKSVGSVRRSGRSTPQNTTPVKKTANTEHVLIPSKKFTVVGTEKSSPRASPLKRKICDGVEDIPTSPKSSRNNCIDNSTLKMTPTRSQARSNLDDDDYIEKVKKCRTEPRRRSLAVCAVNKQDEPKSERKVRRVQSVRLKRNGDEYQAFRDPTPNSDGKKVRSRLSDKFTNIREAEGLRKSGRQVFSDVSNSKSPLKSPKVRSARLK